MSIACRVHIMPSRCFKFMLGSMLLGSVAVGLWLATQTWLPLLWRCAMSFGIALACFFAVWQAKPFLRPWTLQVTAQGKISLTFVAQKTVPVQLLPDSTLWPHCLVLRLQDGDGQTWVVLVLPDSVTGLELRALLVACRWIEARAMGIQAQESQNFFEQ